MGRGLCFRSRWCGIIKREKVSLFVKQGDTDLWVTFLIEMSPIFYGTELELAAKNNQINEFV